MNVRGKPARPDTGEVSSAGADSYALGYSEAEFRRLQFQGGYLRGFTADVLRRAGITPGMRVLDIGCGVGDVSLLAAEMVSSSDTVVGIDRSEQAVAVARQRAAAAGMNHVRFEASEIDAFSPDQPFDALIGRLVLAYLPDPVLTLRRLSGLLRPGGTIAFQEMALPLMRSVPDGPLFRNCYKWMMETFERAGFELDMGGKLHATFHAAGLAAPQMTVAGHVECGSQSPVFTYLADTLRSLVPMAERFGITTATEVAIDTLAERLRKEAVDNNASIMPPPLVGAWTRVPATAGIAIGYRQVDLDIAFAERT
jgi:ubiquinone/menaquinone biosynthesis C-methylase UbiE